MKTINQMTRKEFVAVPEREKWDEPVYCNSLVILPTRHRHSSGYRCMDFVAIDEKMQPICRCSGCSDVLDLNGIGGDRLLELHQEFDDDTLARGSWSIDCLPKSGLLRIMNKDLIRVDAALSNCEIYSIAEKSSKTN